MEAPSETPSVLIVDDDPVLRVLARQALEAAGFEVMEAESGEEGLETLESRTPSMVLLDVEMPGMDGFETCATLRQRPGGREVPVLIATGLTDFGSIERAFDAGATDFITKPINWRILQHRVRFLLRASNAFSEIRRTFSELRESQHRLAKAQRIARIGNWEWDVETDEMIWSEEVPRILGLDSRPERPTLTDFLASVHPEDRRGVGSALRKAAQEGKDCSLDHRIVTPAGEVCTVHQQTETALVDRSSLVVGTIQDVTERKRAEEQIRYLAYYDSLTALPNRRMLKEHLDRSMERCRGQDRMLGLLFLDLDRFKRINDTLGHARGDELLKQVAQRLLACVRANDWIGRGPQAEVSASVSRLGGDEFTVVLPDIREPQDAARVARRVLDELRRPFDLEGQEVVVSASIGIAVHPSDGADVDSLLKNADTAMYHAKDKGRETYQFYSESMNAKAMVHLRMENSLRASLERGDLLLHYQPKIDVKTGRTAGVEALVRWSHPDMGMVYPDEFIPMAEESGLILPLGEWVLREACRQGREWIDAGLPGLQMAVNISSHQVRRTDLAAVVHRALDDASFPARHLELEITESVLLRDERTALEALDDLKRLGVSLALDDFGKGFSSLSYLRKFPFDSLKVDRSFVQDIDGDGDAGAICAAIVAMAHRLNLKVTAEGVMSERQEDFLRAEGCDSMQGYRFSTPVEPEELAAFLRREGEPGR